jgi:hypothetical protein
MSGRAADRKVRCFTDVDRFRRVDWPTGKGAALLREMFGAGRRVIIQEISMLGLLFCARIAQLGEAGVSRMHLLYRDVRMPRAQDAQERRNVHSRR